MIVLCRPISEKCGLPFSFLWVNGSLFSLVQYSCLTRKETFICVLENDLRILFCKIQFFQTLKRYLNEDIKSDLQSFDI